MWVEIRGECLLPFLAMLDRRDEVGDVESLSRRMAAERYPDQDYEENRAWHHRPGIQRVNGMLVPLTMSIRFPATDLPELVARRRAAAMELDGRTDPSRQTRTGTKTNRTASADGRKS